MIDFGKTAEDYSRYRAGFPDEFYHRLRAYDVGKAGQRILDVGTGTGTMARMFARQGARVVALDPSTALMKQALKHDLGSSADILYVRAYAEETSMATNSFDVVTAGQCWHWFQRPIAALELRRVLRPNGMLVIAHFDWVPLPGNVVSQTLQLIQDFNPSWLPADHHLERGYGLYPAWLHDVAVAGYHNLETFSFDILVPYTHEQWRGRIRASAGVAASMRPDVVVQFDSALHNLLQEQFKQQPIEVPHRVWVLLCQA